MAQSEVMKEFLVALGVRVDEAALKKLENGIAQATSAIVSLATAVEATALAVSVGVSKFAANLEQLYFASQRTGASASNLKAFGIAAQNFGASADEALSSVEGLASFMRNNPGGEGMLRGLGLQTRDPKTGELRDTTDLLEDFGKATAKMPFYLANQYAQIFNINEKTLLALRNGGFADELSRIRKEIGATNWKKIAEDAHAFGNEMRDLWVILEGFAARVEDALVKRLGGSMKSLTDWFNDPHNAENASRIIQAIIDGVEKLWGWANKLVDIGKQLFDQFQKWNAESNGWLATIGGVLIAANLLGATSIISGVLNLAAAFVKLGVGIATVGTGGILGAVGAGVAGAWALDKFFPDNPLAKIGSAIGGGLYQYANRYADAVRLFENMGWSHDNAVGIVANLGLESGLNPDAVGDGGHAHGVAQWHDDRWAKYLQWATENNMAADTRESQYAYVNYEARHDRHLMALMNAARNAGTSGEVFSRYYEFPKGGDAEAIRRGNAAVAISQQIDIHVSGAGDPVTTAHRVAEEQSRLNQEMVNNLTARIN